MCLERSSRKVEKGVDHVRIVGLEALVHHKGEDTHLGGTAVVELDGTLLKLGLLVEGVPAEVDESVTEVTNELSLSGDVLHDSSLEDTDEDDDLEETAARHDRKGLKSSWNISEGKSLLVGDVSRKTDSGRGHNVSKAGKLGDTSVLELDEAKTIEALLAGIVEHAEGIEETKRRLDTELALESIEGGLGGSLGGRGESGGRGDKGGGDGRLHGFN